MAINRRLGMNKNALIAVLTVFALWITSSVVADDRYGK